MRAIRAAACLVLAAAGLPAQAVTTVVYPSALAKGGNSQTTIPFASAPMRYQQVIKGFDLAKTIKRPARLVGLRFRGKMSGLRGQGVTLEVWLAESSGTISSFFNNNLKNPVNVVPKRSFTLPTSRAGAWVLLLPFAKSFVWNGTSDLVMDVRIHGNTNSGRPFFYPFDAGVAVPTQRLYSTSGPNATVAGVNQKGVGLAIGVDYVEGVQFTYGKGCRGDGGKVPVIGALNGFPIVGNRNYSITLGSARPQSTALLLWGLSDKRWGSFTLPLDLGNAGITNCTLYAAADFVWSAPTFGGSPGTGQALVKFPIPAIGTLKGLNLYFQWAVVDPASGRKTPLTLSNALRVVIGG